MGLPQKGSDGLRDIRLEGPGYVRRGETVTLSCQYDMEKDTLYQVKWYRGTSEFYRYVPKEVPPTQVFTDAPQVQGIRVDISGSNDHNVVLQSVPLEISGKYKCTVSAEGTFQTISHTKDLNVVAVGYESPFLSVTPDTFYGGETIKANCSIKPSAPAVNITWFMDGKEIPGDKFQTFRIPDMNDSTVATTMSMLTYELPPAFTRIKLKCTGRLFDVYDESSVFAINRAPPQSHSSLSSSHLKPSGSSTAPSGFAQDSHQRLFLMLVHMQLIRLVLLT
ncbi:unnamed protein product [Allacma fusca]|uniref:Ig-like domain-containing protein n=1 Tax=Allacma fusca TaxID=39272 RepID=A0A8J2PVB9_9HEXA|nr:unnamed protein product [Allacma fusca]